MKVKIIVNPSAANGKTGRQWSHTQQVLEDVLSTALDVAFTERQGHGTDITRASLAEGFDTIVAVGGDGTVNEVLNGFFEGGRLAFPDVALGILSQGTGKDFIKSLGMPHDLEAAARAIAERSLKGCDVGRATFVDHQGQPQERYFLNVGDLGFSGAVVERVNRSSKALGGFISYLSGLLTTLATYQNKQVRLRVDDGEEMELVVNSITVANGQYFGGGMWIAPEARIDDRVFDVVIVGDVNRREVIGNVSKLYKGTLTSHSKVKYLRGKRITVDSPERVLIDLDGEQPGVLPVVFEILPLALKCIVP